MRAWKTMTLDQVLRNDEGKIEWNQMIDPDDILYNRETTEKFKLHLYERYFDYEIGFETKEYFTTKFKLRFKVLLDKYDSLFRMEEQMLRMNLFNLVDTETTVFDGLSESEQLVAFNTLVNELFSDTPSGQKEKDIKELLDYISSISKNKSESKTDTKGKVNRKDKEEKITERSVMDPFDLYQKYVKNYESVINQFVSEFHNLFLFLR